MDFDLARRLIELAQELVRKGHSAGDVHQAIVSAAAEQVPGSYWHRLREIDVRGDVEAVGQWMAAAMSNCDPRVSALWLGLHEVGLTTAMPEAALTLSGSSKYPDPEWLFKQDWRFDGYAPAPGLASLMTLAADADSDSQWLVSYAVVFAYSLGMTCEISRSEFGSIALRGRRELAVALGFHDGDILQVGTIQAPGTFDQSGMGWI